MTDIKTPEERSRNMAKIRSKGTAPEEYIRKRLFARGYRYQKSVKLLEGCPDAWLSRYNTALFVHGCFWHRHHGCKYAYTPKSRIDFWQKKFDANVRRDSMVKRDLQNQKIKQLIVWECTIKRMQRDKVYEQHIIQQCVLFIISGAAQLEL